MGRAAKYQTKQKDAIKNYLISLGGGHFTVNQVVDYFERSETPIGMTTVYRYLDRLVQEGNVKKYYFDNQSGACYQLLMDQKSPQHYHLKCECCGRLIHLQCEYIEKMKQHIGQDHQFQIDSGKTVFYGICQDCNIKPE